MGLNYDLVYSEFIKRIQPKYREEYKDCIYRYVVKAKDVVVKDSGEIKQLARYGRMEVKIYPHYLPFYVCPKTNILKRVKT